jgi:hypothetical protein
MANNTSLYFRLVSTPKAFKTASQGWDFSVGPGADPGVQTSMARLA